jgi:hypothetical protein
MSWCAIHVDESAGARGHEKYINRGALPVSDQPRFSLKMQLSRSPPEMTKGVSMAIF